MPKAAARRQRWTPESSPYSRPDTAARKSLAVALALAGILVALRGLERRSWPLHACAGLLYLASILAYEVTLPLVAAAGVLYTIRYGWRAARWPWLADIAVVLVAGLWNATHTHQEISGISGDLGHLGEIVVAGGTLLGRTASTPSGRTATRRRCCWFSPPSSRQVRWSIWRGGGRQVAAGV